MQKKIEQRLGLIMVITTLLVITLTSYLLIRENLDQQITEIHADGANFTRILSNIPYQQLAPENSSSGVLQLVRAYLSNSALAYVAVVDTNGRLVNKISSPDTILPELGPTDNKSLWLTEHQLQDVKTEKEILEFRAPVLNLGTLAGYVRTGYYLPNLQIPREQFSLLAKLALPVFLLMLFFYFLIKREITPIQEANEHICNLISEQGKQNVSVDATGELKDFIENFNYFISLTQNRLNELESDNDIEKTSSNLLAYHKRQVESVLHTMPDAVVVIDDSGQVTFANQKLETVTGMTVESVMGKQPHEWCQDQNVTGLLSRYHGNITPLNRKETVQYSPEEYPDRTIAVSVFPLISPSNVTALMGTLVIFRDVSRDVHLLKSRDEFISHVSHELKSPLNVMLLHTELLSATHEESTEETIESINVIEDEIERLSILINDLLKITQFESDNIVVERQRVKMQDFLEDTFNSAVRGAEAKGIKTQLSISRSLSTLNIDKELFRVALNNLISNAIKYSNSGDTVTLEADELDDAIQIQVSDTGIGIAAEEKSRIFEKFYRSEREESYSRPGHGLGLALAREIVNLHKGELGVESKLNEGAVFTVKLLKTSTYLQEAS